MERFGRLLAQVRGLDLPPDSFAVFGSGPMAAAGLRDVSDLDLVVTPELWRELAARHRVAELPDGGHVIRLGDVEICDSWSPPMGDLSALIEQADVVDGVRFVRLGTVLEWKRKRAEPKDAHDVELLERHLTGRDVTDD